MDVERSSGTLARRALLLTSVMTIVGAGLGVFGIVRGTIAGPEAVIICSCLMYAAGTLFTLLRLRNVALQKIATASTVYFALYLCAGVILTVSGRGQSFDIFVYLVWFFPLLVFNQLVNAPVVARFLASALIVAPVVILVALSWRLVALFSGPQLTLLVVYTLSYVGYGVMLNLVTRYREEYIVERERAETLKVESAVLESISDCFISLDSELRLVYLNDAACNAFGIERSAALNAAMPSAAPRFFSESMLAGLQVASGKAEASMFEAQDETRESWYEMRCFPRPDGMSIYFRNITDRKAADAQIQHLAFHDVLTELPNRPLLRKRLEQALASAVRHGTGGALLYLDLDDFKTLNDTLGHDVGDLFLKQVARRLIASARPADTVARLGGDEFVVMLERLNADPSVAAAEAKTVSDHILEAFRLPFALGTYEYNSTASIGIALFPGDSDTVDDLLKRADLAMYRAKAIGRNLMLYFDPAMETLVASRAALQSDLRRALHNGEFEVHYQPQVNRTGQVIGAEALLRWRHPLRGLVPTGEFIPLAEETGLIVELGRWVLETACAQLAAWAGHPDMERLSIAVNVSLRQFIDASFVKDVLDVLRVSRAEPRRLKLEITESSVMENAADTIAKMTALNAHGVVFSLDDFGTGYSSLSHLRRLPLNQLKLDRSFVVDAVSDARGAAVARTIITLGRDLAVLVIAEGVETEVQRAFLEAAGCDVYQGHLFSPALPSAGFEAFVASALRRDGTDLETRGFEPLTSALQTRRSTS